MRTLYLILLCGLLPCCLPARTRLTTNSDSRDSIAMAMIEALPEVFDMFEQDTALYHKDSLPHVSKYHLEIYKKPGRHFKYYHIQMKEENHVLMNFYVRKRNWKVRYFDAEHNKLLSIARWRRTRAKWRSAQIPDASS